MKCYIWSLTLVIIFCNCGSQHSKGYSNAIFTIGESCTFKLSEEDGIQKGTGYCGNVAINYEYGTNIDLGPLTEVEDFSFAFRGNYYAKFFEIIHIDPRLYRYFTDSVIIKEVRPIENNGDHLLFTCSSCNKSAYLSFRKKDYWFPFYSTLDSYTYFDIETDTLNGSYRKIYFTKSDTLSSGIYLASAGNYKESYKLHITAGQGVTRETTLRLFRSVKYLPNKQIEIYGK